MTCSCSCHPNHPKGPFAPFYILKKENPGARQKKKTPTPDDCRNSHLTSRHSSLVHSELFNNVSSFLPPSFLVLKQRERGEDHLPVTRLQGVFTLPHKALGACQWGKCYLDEALACDQLNDRFNCDRSSVKPRHHFHMLKFSLLMSIWTTDPSSWPVLTVSFVDTVKSSCVQDLMIIFVTYLEDKKPTLCLGVWLPKNGQLLILYFSMSALCSLWILLSCCGWINKHKYSERYLNLRVTQITGFSFPWY